MKFKEIFVRREKYPNEHRTPLTPNDVDLLIRSGIVVYIQSSISRAFSDEEYEKVGAILTPYSWISPPFKDSLILGIKELEYIDSLNGHTHAYFSHSFKNQKDSVKILNNFLFSKSDLYDFEYFLDSRKKRTIAFGFHAGQVAAILGVLEYLKGLPPILTPWSSFQKMLESVEPFLQNANANANAKPISIGILGLEGRCGQGVKSVLNLLNLPFTQLTRESHTDSFKNFDIFYNCILLDESYQGIWFSEKTRFNKPITIVDVSCDSSKPNNPIKLYTKSTTWESPVYKYNDLVSIIAIDNMPSLLPKESSYSFSKSLTQELLNEDSHIWENALFLFYEKALFAC
uniref:Alanine dehydrogenase/pyridine nucleotide transhydrogenase N-terminal domain-containing protein n=1 Tax=viral metagenome TaxID=1070528 RepID=A0A6C0KP99_9ZZZZ